MLQPKGYVYINFVDANNIEVRNSVSYMGNIGDICDVYPAYLEGYEYVGVDGELNGVFDTEPKYITFKYNKK